MTTVSSAARASDDRATRYRTGCEKALLLTLT